MCLMKVREEDYSVPARYTRTRRTIRRSPSPPRARITRQSIVEERQQSYAAPPPPPPPQPLPPPPPPMVSPPSPRGSTTIRSERHVSRQPSRAPSARSRTQTHFVEVDHETSSSSSSSEDLRSRATSHTRKSARSKTTAPASEYSIHEREYRRERGYSSPKPEYETYRYVNAPQDRSVSRGPRSSHHDAPRASRDDFRRETRVVIEDNNGRRQVEYRR